MHLILALAAVAGSASPTPVPAANAATCESAPARAAFLKEALGRSELLTRLANAGLAPERALRAARLSGASVEAARARSLAADPRFAAEQEALQQRIDTLFDGVVAALRNPDEAARCRTVAATEAALGQIEAESAERAAAVARALHVPARMADAR